MGTQERNENAIAGEKEDKRVMITGFELLEMSCQ